MRTHAQAPARPARTSATHTNPRMHTHTHTQTHTHTHTHAHAHAHVHVHAHAHAHAHAHVHVPEATRLQPPSPHTHPLLACTSGPYLLPWVAYNTMVGVDHMALYLDDLNEPKLRVRVRVRVRAAAPMPPAYCIVAPLLCLPLCPSRSRPTQCCGYCALHWAQTPSPCRLPPRSAWPPRWTRPTRRPSSFTACAARESRTEPRGPLGRLTRPAHRAPDQR